MHRFGDAKSPNLLSPYDLACSMPLNLEILVTGFMKREQSKFLAGHAAHNTENTMEFDIPKN